MFQYIFTAQKTFRFYFCVPSFGICGSDVLEELCNIQDWTGQFSQNIVDLRT